MASPQCVMNDRYLWKTSQFVFHSYLPFITLSLESRDMWEIIDRMNHTKCIGNKWVYKAKTDLTGKVVKYKASYLRKATIKRNMYVDYFESYAPVTNISIIRLLLAMSVSQSWKVHHWI